MREFYCDEDAIKVIAPAAVKSGQPYLLGSLFGAFVKDAEAGEEVAFKTVGCIKMPTQGTIAVNSRVFWDATNKKVSATGAAGAAEVGVAIRATENGVTIVRLGVNTVLKA